MELHVVSYGIDSVARTPLLFFSSENCRLWFRYREYDLAHLKLVFEFSIYTVQSQFDTAYLRDWIRRIGVQAQIRRIFLDGYGVLVFRIVIFKISSFKLQNAPWQGYTSPPLKLKREKEEVGDTWFGDYEFEALDGRLKMDFGGSRGESFWEEGDDFGVDVLRFHTCHTDIIGYLEKLEWWFEQDIDDEVEEDEEDGGGDEV
ncbi:hypothetical protein Tco_0186472 [Tanacetum coccineum]